MNRAILKRPQAERDIEEAFVFIAEADFDSGLDFLFAVEQSLELLAANPHIGRQRNFAAPELQNLWMWRVKSYEQHLLFYLIRDDAIELARLIHSARDYRKVLEE